MAISQKDGRGKSQQSDTEFVADVTSITWLLGFVLLFLLMPLAIQRFWSSGDSLQLAVPVCLLVVWALLGRWLGHKRRRIVVVSSGQLQIYSDFGWLQRRRYQLAIDQVQRLVLRDTRSGWWFEFYVAGRKKPYRLKQVGMVRDTQLRDRLAEFLFVHLPYSIEGFPVSRKRRPSWARRIYLLTMLSLFLLVWWQYH